MQIIRRQDNQSVPSASRIWVLGALALCCCATMAFSPLSQTTQPSTSAPAAVQPKDFYGLWAILPPMVAIGLAVITRQVIVALSFGVFTAASMTCVMQGVYNPLRFVTYAMEHYVLGVLGPMNDDGSGVDLGHITIIIYTLFIGAMIGVLQANGGTRSVVARVTRRVHTRRAGQLSAYVAGLLVFFDDYANAMIVGPGLRPIFDRLRISREKLAYIVNWTGAPDSSIFLGTWLAVQISYIDSGFQQLGGNVPEFLAQTSAANTFWATIPYRTYTVLAMLMVLLVALTGRDFGGMRKAEARAVEAAGGEPTPTVGIAAQAPMNHWLLGAVPAVVLVLMTVLLMATTGWSKAQADGNPLSFGQTGGFWQGVVTLLGKADSHYALLYASFAAAVVAVFITVASRTLTLRRTMEGVVSGMTAMFAACIILVLAWGLSTASKALQLGPVVEEFLKAHHFSGEWLPLAAFLAACLISFSTGSTWGTMAILVPPVVSIAAGLLAPIPQEQALVLFYSSVGAAMAGAVFGNTCSPLADVTVLSSIFSECELYAHVRTTLPYALTVLIVSILCTAGLDNGLRHWHPAFHAQHWSVYYGLAAGMAMLLVCLLVFGRRPAAENRETGDGGELSQAQA
jgi:Na+/H+ antiporter NhaC